MKRVVLASSNKRKLAEMKELLKQLKIQLINQNQLNVKEIEETGTTFIENALLKARNAAEQTGLAAISDDSGIEVDALDGAPGVYSARYAGVDATDNDNIQKLLETLKDIPEDQRTARFKCAMVYVENANDANPIICEGTWEGRILVHTQGHEGFGYDPIFYLTNKECTAAQLSIQEKNKISHRGQALKALLTLLEKRFK